MHLVTRRRFVIGAIAILLPGPGTASDVHSDALFEDYVLPILKKNCYRCHSHEHEKAKGGLVVDSRHGLLTGGDLGPAISPGKPDESLLIEAVSYRDSDLQMPPKGKLSEDEIGRLREWIERGAPDPRKSISTAEPVVEATRKTPASLWSLEKISDPALPAVPEEAWPRQPLDHFVAARLEARGLQPTKDADPYRLLRRLHFVLTGLPPSTDEVSEFVRRHESGDGEAAVSETVDRLLGTTAFGERWGRHWLDLVRYADVHGGTRPEPITEAWRYRQYVIDSMSSDKPFDEFIREQLAGDLLAHASPEERAAHLVATAFLALGHYDTNEKDHQQVSLDRVDEQLDLVGRAFLGISLGCARCHDHKFDPVPTRDYYALAGIFRSTETLTYPRRRAARMVLEELPAVDSGAPLWMAARRTQFRDKNRGNPIQSKNGPPMTLVAREAPRIVDEPVHLRGEPDKIGEIVPRGFLSAIAMEKPPSIPSAQSGRLELAEWLLHPENPLTARVLVNRFWHHLFGHGLVRSVDNFGATGERPSHPDLLDHLASRFRTVHAWSLRSFIREVVLSRTWRMGGEFDVAAHEIDPDNRLLWRMNRRRFDGETVHDWFYELAGRLDRRPAQFTVPSFRVSNQSNTARIEIPPTTLARRAVYWPVFRKDVPVAIDLLDLFDFPDAMTPTGARDSTTLPSQALYLLGSGSVLDVSRAIAGRLQESEKDEARRIRLAFLTILQRSASTEDVTQSQAFLDAFAEGLRESRAAKNPRVVAWNRFCHTLLISNESLTVE